MDGRARQPRVDTDAALFEVAAVVIEGRAHELVQLEPLALELDLVLRHARDVEQIIDQADQLADLAVDDRA